MWSSLPALTSTLCLLLLLCLPTLLGGVRTTWIVKRKTAAKRGIALNCTSSKGGGQIVGLSVVGFAKECQGLTISTFVQMNSCMWKDTCTIKPHKNDKYMLKLFGGSPTSCILQTPKKLNVSYQCTAPKVAVLNVLDVQAAERQEERGIVRSHGAHPWLYGWHRVGQGRGGGGGGLTLRNPSQAKAFVYRILTLKLMHKDVLNVTSAGRTRNVTLYGHDSSSGTTEVIEGAESVTFRLEMSRHSLGGEGFVVCFQWVAELGVEDACSGLFTAGQKPAKPTRKRCRKGRKGKKGKKGKKCRQKKN